MKSIQRAVWSFWTKPYLAHHHNIWFSEKHHLLSWLLSVENARQFFPETVLITDDLGFNILVDGIGLKFDKVSTELNDLADSDPDWWVLGKLKAYQAQTQPFIHIDNDVFLWKPLPERVDTAPVIAQNSEYFTFGNHSIDSWWYRPDNFHQKIKESEQGWVPQEWQWFVEHQGNWGFCCGILGGNQVDFLRHYASLALKIAEHPYNQIALSDMGEKRRDSILVEQYFLAACIEYHKNQINTPYHGVNIECLFASQEEAFTPSKAEEVGYTHLIGDTKKNSILAQRLEKRVSQDFPHLYERCIQYLEV